MPPAPRPAAVRPSPSNRAKMAARGTGGARARARAGPTNGSAERRGRRPSPGDIERHHAPSPRARRSAERWMTSRAFRAPPRPCPRRAPPLAADWWRGGGGARGCRSPQAVGLRVRFSPQPLRATNHLFVTGKQSLDLPQLLSGYS